MNEVKSTTQTEINLTLTNLDQLSYIKEREREEATANYMRLMESGVGVALNLGFQPAILLKGRERRSITAYTAVYRRGDTVKFCEFNGNTSISDSNGDWNILLVPHNDYPELYLAAGGQMMFFPEESFVQETDFLEVYYRTENYQGILRQTCHDGVPCVFSEINTNKYGTLYGQLIDEMASLTLDISALQTLNNLAGLNPAQDNGQLEVVDEW